jgi:hypothetical protein
MVALAVTVTIISLQGRPFYCIASKQLKQKQLKQWATVMDGCCNGNKSHGIDEGGCSFSLEAIESSPC